MAKWSNPIIHVTYLADQNQDYKFSKSTKLTMPPSVRYREPLCNYSDKQTGSLFPKADWEVNGEIQTCNALLTEKK